MKVEAEHSTQGIGRELHVCLTRTLAKPRHQCFRPGAECLVDTRLGELAQRLEPRSHRQRISRECARLVDPTLRRDVRHQLPATPVRGGRQPAPHDLPKRGQVGLDLEESLSPARRNAEARHHLVENEQGAALVAGLSQTREEARLGRDEPHVARHRLDDHAGDLVTPARERVFHRREVVVRRLDRELGHCLGYARTAGDRQRRHAATGSDQQSIRVPVIAALELEDPVSPRHPSRQADRAHRRFGAGTHHANLLHARQRGADRFRQLDLELRRCTEARSLRQCLAHCRKDLRLGVTEDQRTPGAHVVDELIPIDVPDATALAPRDEGRSARNGVVGPHWAVDTTGDHALRASEKPPGLLEVHSSPCRLLSPRLVFAHALRAA